MDEQGTNTDSGPHSGQKHVVQITDEPYPLANHPNKSQETESATDAQDAPVDVSAIATTYRDACGVPGGDSVDGSASASPLCCGDGPASGASPAETHCANY